MYAEDFSTGVDYLGTLDYIDREKIGAIGICGSGGFALSAAAADARIKAVATSVMYDISSFGNNATGEERQQSLANLAQARWDEVDHGPTVNFSYPEEPLSEVLLTSPEPPQNSLASMAPDADGIPMPWGMLPLPRICP